MSKYTTGEIAKLCSVSVRTVQYYDTRGLLVPSELTEGGRRLYNDDDLKMMKIICFLREAGLPINSISELLKEENPENVISVILAEQEKVLKDEMAEREKQLSIIETIKQEMKEIESFSVESIGDIAHLMKNKKQLKKLRTIILTVGIPATLLLWTSIILAITMGMWWLFAVGAVLYVFGATFISVYYFRNTAYICPNCHHVFKPSFKEALFADHTPKMRRLTCPECNHKGLCIEVFAEKEATK